MLIYFWERERESMHEQGRGREREKEVQSGFRTDSRMPDAGLESMNYEIVPWAKVRHLTNWATQVPLFIFSLAYFIERIQYIINLTYEIHVNQLLRLLVNSSQFVVKFLGNRKLYSKFWLHRRLTPQPVLFKSQRYICVPPPKQDIKYIWNSRNFPCYMFLISLLTLTSHFLVSKSVVD